MAEEPDEQMKFKRDEPKRRKQSFREFMRWYFRVDLKDVTNYIALAIALFLLWWGISNILKALTMKGP